MVAEDFDNDGGMDLVMTTYELWPVRRQRLLVYHNEIAGRGNWIGFRFDWRSPARSLVGAKLIVDTAAGKRTHWFVTGDSYRSQSSFSAHFGLGKIAGVSGGFSSGIIVGCERRAGDVRCKLRARRFRLREKFAAKTVPRWKMALRAGAT